MDEPSKILSNQDTSPEDWVKAYCQLHGITYDYKTHSFRHRNETIDSTLLLSQIRLLLYKLNMNHLKSLVPDALLVWRQEQAKLFLSEFREQLRFRPSQRDLVMEWVKAITIEQDGLSAFIMRHFIWQVKRKVFYLPVEHHMMPVLYGKSGGGKSVAIWSLLKPLEAVSSSRDMSIFNDSFSRKAFTRNFVLFFDEMAKCQQTDINSLKNVITAPSIDWRSIGTENMMSGRQNCTFIAATNTPLRERIYDPTSARRFYQINTADKLDWATINSIDYSSLWQSVDENGPCPLLLVLPEIQTVQEKELRGKDLVEQWLEFGCAPTPFSEESPNTEKLYEEFKKYCAWQKIVAFPGIQSFARGLQHRIEQLRWTVSSKHSSRGTVWSLRINKYV